MKQPVSQQSESNRILRFYISLCLVFLFVAGLSRITTSKPSTHADLAGSDTKFSARHHADKSHAISHRSATGFLSPSGTASGDVRKPESRTSSSQTPKRDIGALYRGRGKMPRPEPPDEMGLLILTDLGGLDATESSWGLNGRVEADYTNFTTALDQFYQNESTVEKAGELLHTTLTEDFETYFAVPGS